MRVFRHLEEIPADWNATIVSIGNFDGVHCGHQHVLARVVERAKQSGSRSMAVTFDPHPVRVLRPESAPLLITPLDEKLAGLAKTGVDATLVITFDKQFSSTTPRDFARKIVAGSLRAREVHEGANFHFGHRAEGDCEKLKEFGKEFGFKVFVYPEMRLRGEPVSSSRIRQLLSAGEVSKARHLLGRPFSIISTPAKGRGYGSRYTVPTINLAPYSELVPRNGVYVTCTSVARETFESVTNVGIRPTFAGESFAIETHLLNFHPVDLDESTEVEISFLKWLRPEIKWPNPEALKEQIGKDVGKAKRFFALKPQTRSAT
ncbi:MAG TPA: bifunctional riboflavin kinase/FAD synthetase [Terriglobales bacterium]|nr:bifunctional riboflavin kinase/FAD synthetase [Terriglobales bacterium]